MYLLTSLAPAGPPFKRADGRSLYGTTHCQLLSGDFPCEGERPQDEVKTEAAAQNISWGTLKRASEGGQIIKRKDGFGAGARSFWGLS